MTAAVAAAAKARAFLLFVGIASLLGLNWSVWDRIVIGLAIVVAVTVEVGFDGHHVWPPRRSTSPRNPA
jgi:hypothetical protein